MCSLPNFCLIEQMWNDHLTRSLSNFSSEDLASYRDSFTNKMTQNGWIFNNPYQWWIWSGTKLIFLTILCSKRWFKKWANYPSGLVYNHWSPWWSLSYVDVVSWSGDYFPILHPDLAIIFRAFSCSEIADSH